MMKSTTHVIMIIDKSGSMHHLESDVIGGFNQYIDNLKKDTENRYRVTVVLFDTAIEHLCKDVALKNVPVLDDTNYMPRNGTALHDAVGQTITAFDDNGTGRVLVAVNTDGYENSSKEWTVKGVRSLIDGKPKDRWGFVFLGAHADAWQQGLAYGMSSGQTINTSAGTRGTYSGMSHGTRAYAAGASGQSVTESAMKASAEQDQEEDKK